MAEEATSAIGTTSLRRSSRDRGAGLNHFTSGKGMGATSLYGDPSSAWAGGKGLNENPSLGS